VYYALVPLEVLNIARPGLSLVSVDRLPRMAFDHQNIVELALSRVRSKSQYSSLPVHLCGERLTLPHLQAVYESVLGEPINKVSFRRKIEEMGILEPVEGELETGAAHRPAQVYRLRPEFRRDLSWVARGLKG
jgi:8-oxo-dGTP diphosphatase